MQDIAVPTIKVWDFDGYLWVDAEVVSASNLDDDGRMALTILPGSIMTWPEPEDLLIFELRLPTFGYMGSGRVRSIGYTEAGVTFLIKFEHEFDRN